MQNIEYSWGGIKKLSCLVLLFSIFYILYSIFTVSSVHAQLEIADTYDMSEQGAVNGDLVSLQGNGLIRSKVDYDNTIFGVVTTDPLAAYKRVDETGTIISRTGVVDVNVTTANGDIKTGDYITTSTIAGKGQKALATGYVVGVAMKDFKSGEGTQIDFADGPNGQKVSSGTIPVAIRIEYAEIDSSRNANSLIQKLNSALFTNVKDPEKFINVIRYIASGLIVMISILVGLLILSRILPRGVESIGRNPLARQSIIFYTAVNVIIVIVIIVLGTAASVLLIRI
jgi:hypothetical protein